ncbi:MAG: HTTM domain-containing protein [Saprospiraceae bacterium]|nr:HTTM domain-containing protein [Saprospiraceae bacterium]
MQKTAALLFKPVDISSLIFFRIAFGGILLIEVCRYFQLNWIHRYWVAPDFFFTFEGFHWVKPFEGNGMYIFFVLLGIAAFCVMLGLFYRIASVFLFLGFTYIFLLDKTNYLNHFYLISLLGGLMTLMPAHRALSMDAKYNPSLRSDYTPCWAPALLVFQLGVAYFYGGIAKINADWLHGQPMFLWMAQDTDFPVIGRYFTEPWMVYFFTYSGLLLDLLIVPALLWKKTRVWAFIFITLFHLMNHNLWSIGIFPWFMMAATTVFFEPDWFRRLLNAQPVNKWRFPLRADVPAPQFKPSTPLMVFLAIYVPLQLLIPLRHLVIDGNVSWDERGHRFSWHMKLRDKRAKAAFKVVDLDTREEWRIDQKDYLSSRQRLKMSTRPDMILQFAHHLGDQFRQNGVNRVAVYADVQASLNGRPYQQLIRPDVDLMTITRFSAAADWIVPLSTPLSSSEKNDGEEGDAAE